MAVRFLHLADLHLGSRHEYLGESADAREREVLEAFRTAVETALDPQRGIDGVLISGNLFDRHSPDPETLSFVRGLLGRLVAERKPVVLVPGFRDSYAYKDSVYRTERWPGIDVVRDAVPGTPVKHTIRDQDVYFHGVAAQPGVSPKEFGGFEPFIPEATHPDDAGGDVKDLTLDAPEDLLAGELSLDDDSAVTMSIESGHTPSLMAAHIADPGIHVGLLCAELPDHPEAGTRPFDQYVDPSTLAGAELDYVALGGYHGFATYQLEGTTAAYPGSLVGRRFHVGDIGKKSLLVVDIDHGNVEFARVPIESSHLEEWTIDLRAERIADPDALTSAILARAGNSVIARITLAGPPEFICDLEQVADTVRQRFRHLELVDDTDLLGSGLLRRIQSEHTIRGFFVRRMLTHITELEDRAITADPASDIHRDLLVARAALKVGLEQFLDQEPASDVLTEHLARPASPNTAPGVETRRPGSSDGLAMEEGA